MKKLILITLLFIGSISWSQYTITSVTYNNSNFCQYDSKTFKVVATHPIGNVPTLSMNSTSDNGYLILYSAILDSTAITGGTSYFSFNAEDMYMVADNADENDLFTITLNDVFGLPQDSYDVIDIVVYGNINPIIDLSSLSICSNGLPFDLNDYVSLLNTHQNIQSYLQL